MKQCLLLQLHGNNNYDINNIVANILPECIFIFAKQNNTNVWGN